MITTPKNYTTPSNVLPVPEGSLEPNSSLPCWSGVIGRIVALHRFSDGTIWVLFQNHDGQWVNYRRATVADEDHFVAAGAAIRA